LLQQFVAPQAVLGLTQVDLHQHGHKSTFEANEHYQS